MMALDIVSIGEPMIEFNQTRPDEPNYLQGFGGDTSNMIIAAARSGARAAYVTRVGDDDFGRMFLALWEKEGIDTRGVAIDPQAPTGAYFVRHGPQGHAFSYLRAGSAASRLRPEDLPLALIREARHIHASGISMAISASAADAVLAAFEAARAAGAKVSFDPNLRLKLWPLEQARKKIAAAAAMTDFFLSEPRGRAHAQRPGRRRCGSRLGAWPRPAHCLSQAGAGRRNRQRRREAPPSSRPQGPRGRRDRRRRLFLRRSAGAPRGGRFANRSGPLRECGRRAGDHRLRRGRSPAAA
jgi:hypothetical protein